MATYICDDGMAEITVEAESPMAAAREYVDSGSWGEDEVTRYIDVHVWADERDDEHYEGLYSIRLDPQEPPCSDDRGHDWTDAGSRGHGGGVVARDVCTYCGRVRITDTWATAPSTGEQGLETMRYEEADDAE